MAGINIVIFTIWASILLKNISIKNYYKAMRQTGKVEV